jgi:hypothetical protein
MHSLRLMTTFLVASALSGCCVLTYCGPSITGTPCDAGSCPTGSFCDLTTTAAGGFCTRPCTRFGTSGNECEFSAETLESVCALPRLDGGLECTPWCDFDAGFYPCPAGLRCLMVDGGGAAPRAPGTCL